MNLDPAFTDRPEANPGRLNSAAVDEAPPLEPTPESGYLECPDCGYACHVSWVFCFRCRRSLRPTRFGRRELLDIGLGVLGGALLWFGAAALWIFTGN